jgi:hypothetical protein
VVLPIAIIFVFARRFVVVRTLSRTEKGWPDPGRAV